jgi:hypothetical protein
MPLYRISPVLWHCPRTGAQTVYSIDRSTPLIPSICSSRYSEDPASVWESKTFQRLTIPDSQDMVVWSTLPLWLSSLPTWGYTIPDMSKVKPYDSFYIEGP